METNDTIATLAEILGMEPAMLRRAVEAARARNDEAGLSALMMRAADAKMAAGLTDNIRRTVRGEQAGAFSVAICMEWNALYEQALTATETALSEVTHQRDVFRSCLRRAAESVSAHPLSGAESADSLAEFVVQEVSGLRDETLRAVQDVILLRDKAINERDAERTRADRAEAALATARSEALREAAGVPSQVIAELRHRGLLTAGDESVARSIESGILALIGASESESGPPRRAETIFGCRTCGASTKGWSDGRFAATGWRRLDHIDGPNAICLTCAADPTALDCLRDEYPRVALASESGEGK